jgi:hypothetical protein
MDKSIVRQKDFYEEDVPYLDLHALVHLPCIRGIVWQPENETGGLLIFIPTSDEEHAQRLLDTATTVDA